MLHPFSVIDSFYEVEVRIHLVKVTFFYTTWTIYQLFNEVAL